MHPLSRALFLAVPPSLLALGFLLHLQTPMAPRIWLLWFALTGAATFLLVRRLRPAALEARLGYGLREPAPAASAAYGAVPPPPVVGALARGGGALAALYFLAVLLLPAAASRGLSQSFHVGQWILFAFMPYAAAKFLERGAGWAEAALAFSVGSLPVLLSVPAGDCYSARLWLISLAPVFVVVSGNRRLKILTAAAAALFALSGCIVLHAGLRRAYPLYSWFFAGDTELYGSYILSLQHAVYRLAGPAGAGAEYIPQVGLVRPWDMPLNGVPYLALWIGTAWARAAVASLGLLLAAAFFELVGLRSPVRRAVACGLWFLASINVYVGALALFHPEFLTFSIGAWGLPFFGSFESALQLVLTLLVILGGARQRPSHAGKAGPSRERPGPDGPVPDAEGLRSGVPGPPPGAGGGG
ncbi:MAG: hypothetical protein LBG06_01220 [Deltaproteobacteria bacterium]|jgi:hypothetical protein|nr:hypothetical protein [Deltaproteobacteria bacterium]